MASFKTFLHNKAHVARDSTGNLIEIPSGMDPKIFLAMTPSDRRAVAVAIASTKSNGASSKWNCGVRGCTSCPKGTYHKCKHCTMYPSNHLSKDCVHKPKWDCGVKGCTTCPDGHYHQCKHCGMLPSNHHSHKCTARPRVAPGTIIPGVKKHRHGRHSKTHGAVVHGARTHGAVVHGGIRHGPPSSGFAGVPLGTNAFLG